jgi:soluble P-type ATPase
MLEIHIPGGNDLTLNYLVLDYNGTLAEDGRLLPQVSGILTKLAATIQLHVITADTFGSVESALSNIPCKLVVISKGEQDQEKLNYVEMLGKEQVVAIGNGRNDILMLKAAVLGIAVIQAEGAFSGTVQAADVICTNIVSALALLTYPSRLKATLRA